jgi:hypothetical protein
VRVLCNTAAGALVAVGLLVLMLLMSEAHPAGAILLPGLHGKIAYQGHDGHDWEIYTINAGGGGGQVLLTDNSTNDKAPSWGNRHDDNDSEDADNNDDE